MAYLYINVTRRKTGAIDTTGYRDRDTALINAGMERGAGSDILHCAVPLRVPSNGEHAQPIFHADPEEDLWAGKRWSANLVDEVDPDANRLHRVREGLGPGLWEPQPEPAPEHAGDRDRGL